MEDNLDLFQLQRLIQEVLISVSKANHQRTTGLEEKGQLPTWSWVRRFAARHNLVQRYISIKYLLCHPNSSSAGRRCRFQRDDK